MLPIKDNEPVNQNINLINTRKIATAFSKTNNFKKSCYVEKSKSKPNNSNIYELSFDKDKIIAILENDKNLY